MIDFGRSGERSPEGREEGEGAGSAQEPFYDPFYHLWADPTYAPQYEAQAPDEGQREWSWPSPEQEDLAQLRRQMALAGQAGQLVRPGEKAAPIPARRRLAVTMRELVETLLLALLIFLAVRASLQNFRVEGASMIPNLHDGQYLIVNKLAYAKVDLGIFDWVPFFDPGENSVHHIFGVPERGDVIVFRAPNSPQRDFIKRIIGVPGDTVEIKGNVVYVNGAPLDELYIQGPTSCPGGCGPWTVAPGQYFVMGDNRGSSSDSRQGWLVPEENIIGKALFSYWPLSEAGLAPNKSVSFAKQAAAEE